MVQLIELGRRLGFITERLSRNVYNRTNEAARAIAHDLPAGTPVDTGFARSNWRASLDQPLSGTIPPHHFGRAQGIGETRNLKAAIQAAEAVIAQRRPGQHLFFTNNVAYIDRLNAGSSSQAAAGFVERAIRRANAIIGRTGYLR